MIPVDSEQQSRKSKKVIVSKGLCSRDMVVSYQALSLPFCHFGEKCPPKRRNGRDGSRTKLEIWHENSEKAIKRLILFLRTTKLRSMVGCNREVPSPAFYSGGASLQCGVWW